MDDNSPRLVFIDTEFIGFLIFQIVLYAADGRCLLDCTIDHGISYVDLRHLFRHGR